MTAEPSPRQQVAAWHGLATNPVLPVDERLACALKALEGYEKELAEALVSEQQIKLDSLRARFRYLAGELTVGCCDGDLDPTCQAYTRAFKESARRIFALLEH